MNKSNIVIILNIATITCNRNIVHIISIINIMNIINTVNKKYI